MFSFLYPKSLNILKYTRVNYGNNNSKNTSYDEVIQKVVFIAKTCKTQPKLSQETVQAIERARTRLKQGNFLTKEEAKKRLGYRYISLFLIQKPLIF